MNIRSLAPKIDEIESLIILLGYPKIFLLSETWLDSNSPLQQIPN